MSKLNFIDAVIGLFSPESACRRAFFREELERYGYDAGDSGRLNQNWTGIVESAEMTDRWNRDIVRGRARDLERNSDVMGSLVSAFTRNVVGKGFVLQARTGDENLNVKIETLWKEWASAKNCDVTGQQTFNQLLRMAVRRKKVDGGVLFKKCYTNYGVIPFQLQMIEVDELSNTWESPHSKKNKVVGGIEYNQYNRPVGYWITQYSINGMETATPQYVKADDIIFLYSKRRPSQIREMSDMSQTLTRIRDMNEFANAVSVKERISACLSIFVKKAAPGATGYGRNSIATAAQTSYENRKLSPGMIMEMGAGDEIQVVDPKGAAADATAFLKLQQHLIGAGQGLSFEATSRNMSETNYSSARQGIIEDGMTYAEDVELLQENLLDEVYRSFLQSAVMCGAIKIKDFATNKNNYFDHYWTKAPKQWIDPLKESNAARIALESGQKTFAQIAAENGRDWREQIDEMAEIAKYAGSLGISFPWTLSANKADETGNKENGNDDDQKDELAQDENIKE